jgi:hypothetical protein
VGPRLQHLCIELRGIQLTLRRDHLIGRRTPLERQDHAVCSAERIAPADQSVKGSEGSRDYDIVGLVVIFGA